MRDRGLEYLSPADAVSELTTEWFEVRGTDRAASFEEKERSVARADVDCQLDSLIPATLKVHNEVLEQLADDGSLNGLPGYE
jgi:hypothetical protein